MKKKSIQKSLKSAKSIKIGECDLDNFKFKKFWFVRFFLCLRMFSRFLSFLKGLVAFPVRFRLFFSHKRTISDFSPDFANFRDFLNDIFFRIDLSLIGLLLISPQNPQFHTGTLVPIKFSIEQENNSTFITFSGWHDHLTFTMFYPSLIMSAF